MNRSFFYCDPISNHSRADFDKMLHWSNCISLPKVRPLCLSVYTYRQDPKSLVSLFFFLILYERFCLKVAGQFWSSALAPLNITHFIQIISRPFHLGMYHTRSWDCSVRIARRLQAGRSGFDSWQENEIFLFSTASKPTLGPTQSPIQWVSGALSQGLKGHGGEAQSIAEVWIGGSIPTLPHTCML
jgi:hypothetical protein